MISIGLGTKFIINVATAIAFLYRGRGELALMFAGFAVADAGAFWIAMK